MNVEFKCIDVNNKLIGKLVTKSFLYVPGDSSASTWLPKFISDLITTPQDDSHPFFRVITDKSKVEEVEREFVAPLHRTAAAKYCKQMKDIRDRSFGLVGT